MKVRELVKKLDYEFDEVRVVERHSVYVNGFGGSYEFEVKHFDVEDGCFGTILWCYIDDCCGYEVNEENIEKIKEELRVSEMIKKHRDCEE